MTIEVQKGRTVLGIFPDGEAARTAIERMTAAGFAADDVGVTSDPRQAREPAGSRSFTGAIVGAVIGTLVGVAWVLWAGNAAGWFVVPMYTLIGVPIGWLAGRARLFQRGEYARLERSVERGSTIVTVRCDEAEVQRAAGALRDAGASSVRLEDTAEEI